MKLLKLKLQGLFLALTPPRTLGEALEMSRAPVYKCQTTQNPDPSLLQELSSQENNVPITISW